MPEKDHAVESTANRTLQQTAAALARIANGTHLRQAVPEQQRSPMLHNVLMTILRHQAAMDWAIARWSNGKVRPRLRHVLHWAFCQIVYLDGLPAPVAVNTCVDFVKRRYAHREANFVNALLRRLVSLGPEAFRRMIDQDAPAHVRLELGAALYRRWKRRFTELELTELARLLQQPAPLTLRLRPGAPEPNLACLRACSPVPWAPDCSLWTCTAPATLFASAEFRRGDLYVQDPATLLAPALLAPRPGETVGALCAAPGGKALVLADALAGHGVLICMDRSPSRADMLRRNLARTKHCLSCVGDAALPPFGPRAFDAVLLDVPCTNTGVIRRRPDVRQHFSNRALREMEQLQARILDGATTVVRPGGRIVYSTCSIEPEENAEQVKTFLARHPDFERTAQRHLLPEAGHDGAYAAVLRQCRAQRARDGAERAEIS